MALKIEYVSPSSLKAYDKNSRTHSESQVEQIINSIREFGFVNPILIGEDNVVIAGHGRLMAAMQMESIEVPVIKLHGLSERQRRALVIADNKIASNAGWDFSKLGDELSTLVMEEFDLGLTGFNEQEIDALLKEDIGILPDEWGGPETVTVSQHKRKTPQDEDGDFQDQGVGYKAQYGVIVMCDNESDQQSVYDRLSHEGFKCKIVVT